MPSGISISIASETREYAQGIQRGVVEPTEDAQKALDDLGKNDAGTELQQSMRTAQRGTEQLKGDIQQLSEQVRAGGRAGTQYGADMKHGMHVADEGVTAAKENTKANLKEVAASFDGTVQSGVQGIQGLAAELLEGFGAGGLIAGAVAAGGIGLLLTGIEDADTRTEAFNADVQALAQSWIEAGKEGKLSTQQIVDGLKNLATQTDKDKASLADVEKQAKALGVPFKELAQVYAEGGDATQYALDRTRELIRADQQRFIGGMAGSRAGIGAMGATNAALAKHIAALEAQRGKLQQVQKETAEAAKREQEWLKAGGPDLQRKADATETYASSVQDAVVGAGAAWDDYATKEGGLSLDKYIQVTKDKVAAIKTYQQNVATLAGEGNQAALDYVESLGMDAAPLLAKFVRAPAAKRAELVAIWASLGKAASSSYKSALEDGLPDVFIPPGMAPVDAKRYLASVRAAQAEAQAYLKAHPLRADAVAYTSYGKPLYG